MKQLCFAAFLVVSGASAQAQNVAVEPAGQFAEIDVAQQNMAVRAVLGGSSDDADAVLAAPQTFSPPVLYALSHYLFHADRKDEALFWFYAAQLRARGDANKSRDPSARQAVSVLNKRFGPQINQYAFADIPRLEQIVERVLTWDAGAARDYDPRWIALHGMGAFNATTVEFAAPERWEAIDEETRLTYEKGFRSAMQRLKSRS